MNTAMSEVPEHRQRIKGPTNDPGLRRRVDEELLVERLAVVAVPQPQPAPMVVEDGAVRGVGGKIPHLAGILLQVDEHLSTLAADRVFFNLCPGSTGKFVLNSSSFSLCGQCNAPFLICIFMEHVICQSRFPAGEIAREEGIGELTPAHWQVIDYCRKSAAANGSAPTLRTITNGSGVTTKDLFALFPKGPAKKVARISGLGKPEGCV